MGSANPATDDERERVRPLPAAVSDATRSRDEGTTAAAQQTAPEVIHTPLQRPHLAGTGAPRGQLLNACTSPSDVSSSSSTVKTPTRKNPPAPAKQT